MCSALETGGAERQWSILIPGLAERGYETEVLTLAGRGRFFDEIQAAGVPSHCAELRSRWDLRGLRRALGYANRRLDIVMSRETNAQVVGLALASRARAAHVTMDQTPPGLPRGAHRRLLLRLIAPRVDRVIAVSRSQIPELVSLGFDEARTRVIYNAVEPLWPTKTRDQTRASIEVESRDFVALLVAALRPQKRIPFFIEAVAAAHRADERIKGIVAGGGPALETFRALAAANGSSVRLLGERTDIADLLVAADAACLTSWTEATPLALIEAMSLSRPVVSTPAGGVDEVVVDGKTGIVVRDPDPQRFADALQALAADANYAQALGAAGKARFEDLFSAENMIDQYVEVFDSVLKQRLGSVRPA